MAVPKASINIQDGVTGVVTPGSDAVLAIIAPSSAGPTNEPSPCSGGRAAQSEFGFGFLPDAADYVMRVGGHPTVLIRPTTATAGDYSAFVKTGGGTATPAEGLTAPNDDYTVSVRFLTGGALGTTGITYQYHLGGGWSAIKALGTALNIVIPDTGITIVLGTSTQTILAGQVCSFSTTGPQATTSDLATSLEALRVSALDWEAVLIHGDCTGDHVTLVDQWLAGLAAKGKHRWAIFNTRRWAKGTETAAEYITALSAIRASGGPSSRIIFCADGGEVLSVLRGIKQFRPTAMGVAGRAMKIDLGVDPAYVADGPLTGYSIIDGKGNPLAWDEAKTEGLDALKFTILRTHEKRAGAYVNNANVFSSESSDFVYLPHLRTMNLACDTAFDTLTSQLGKGVTKNPKPGPNNARYISEESAAAIEGMVQANLERVLKGRVDQVQFKLSRTDDISSNGPAKVTGTLKIVAFGYVKEFDITASFAKAIEE